VTFPTEQQVFHRNPQIGFASVSLGDRAADELVLAAPAGHVIIAPGAAGQRVFDAAEALGGGPAFTASARFGQAIALIEIAAAAEPPAAGAPSMSPVASMPTAIGSATLSFVYGTIPMSTLATAMYSTVHNASDTRIPNGRSFWGFFASWAAVDTASKPM
jgi:hypothetical protein